MHGEARCECCGLKEQCTESLSTLWGPTLPQGCPNASLFNDIARYKCEDADTWKARPSHDLEDAYLFPWLRFAG